MSMHSSLRIKKFRQNRSVRKRWERIAKLKRTEKFVEGMSVYGLPKEKILKIRKKIKDEKKKEEIQPLGAPTQERK